MPEGTLSNLGRSISGWLSGTGYEQGQLGATDPKNMGVDLAELKMPPNVEHFLKTASEEELMELGVQAGRMGVRGTFMKDLARKTEEFNKGLRDVNESTQKIVTSVVQTRAHAVRNQAQIYVNTAKAGREMSFDNGRIYEHRQLGHVGRVHQAGNAIKSIFAEHYG